MIYYHFVQSEIGRWQDKVRRTIIEEGDPSTSGKLISAVNKIMDQIKKDILKKVGLINSYTVVNKIASIQFKITFYGDILTSKITKPEHLMS